jgi:hypothetical protein
MMFRDLLRRAAPTDEESADKLYPKHEFPANTLVPGLLVDIARRPALPSIDGSGS